MLIFIWLCLPHLMKTLLRLCNLLKEIELELIIQIEFMSFIMQLAWLLVSFSFGYTLVIKQVQEKYQILKMEMVQGLVKTAMVQ